MTSIKRHSHKCKHKGQIASLEVESETELAFQSSNHSNSLCCDNTKTAVALSLLFRFFCISAVLLYLSWLQLPGLAVVVAKILI